jgi:hypothetical protein
LVHNLSLVHVLLALGAAATILWAALSAVVCAVAMLARALVLTIKLRQQT